MKHNNPTFNASIMKKISVASKERLDSTPLDVAKNYFASNISLRAELGETDITYHGKIFSLTEEQREQFFDWLQEKGFNISETPNKLTISWDK